MNGNVIDLNPYIGQANVQIRFYYNDGGQWAYGLAVDNIRVYTDSPTTRAVSCEWELVGQWDGRKTKDKTRQISGAQTAPHSDAFQAKWTCLKFEIRVVVA